MAGIGSAIMPPQGAADNEQMETTPDQETGAGEEQPNVTPEEQAQYDQFVENGLEIIYPKGEQAQVSSAVTAHLQGQFEPEAQNLFEKVDPPLANSPVDNVAATGVLIVLTLEGSANGAGHELSDDIILHGGAAILEELIQVAETMKLHDFSEQEVEGVTYRAMDIYRVTSPRADPESLGQEFGQIAEADKAGTLDQMLPGIGERLKQGA